MRSRERPRFALSTTHLLVEELGLKLTDVDSGKKCLFQYFLAKMVYNSEDCILQWEHFLVLCGLLLSSSPTSFSTDMTPLSPSTLIFLLSLKHTHSPTYLLSVQKALLLLLSTSALSLNSSLCSNATSS